MPKIRVGFIVGKDTDFVEHPGKGPNYSKVGDVSFLKDMPDDMRVDPVSHEYVKDCDKGTKGLAHCDVALAWYIKKHYKDIEIDMISPDDLSIQRLHANDLNFTMGYNALSVKIEGSRYKGAQRKLKAFTQAKNIYPDWAWESFIMQKSSYMKACMADGVPMAPTIIAPKGKRSPAQLMRDIKSRGWKTFVMKQSESGFCLGFLKLTVEKCEKDPKILENYFKDYAQCPEFIVQEAIEGFTRNWETRVFWFNGKFLYAIANMAGVSTKDGKEKVIAGKDIPKEFLENAVRIGRKAIKSLPDMKTANGKSVKNILVRTDIGCSDSKLNDKHTNWDPKKRTFFLNEIEPSSTTYFVRFLPFDCIPMYAKLYVQKAREIYKLQKAGGKVSEKKMQFAKSANRSKVSMKSSAATGKSTSKAKVKKSVLKTKARAAGA